jgi:hypothetical protein
MRTPRHAAIAILGAGLLLAAASCGSPAPGGDDPARAPSAKEAKAAVAAWQTVYDVLQHPRCANCHPAGDVPLQGDAMLPHAQNVRRGKDGTGMFALRCANCHLESNQAGPNLPPGAPHWQMARPEMPLVFVGRSSEDLCRQLQDPAQNGGRTLEELYEHMAKDPLVLWGWDPGTGRAPVATPHSELLAALRKWIDGGCACPEE